MPLAIRHDAACRRFEVDVEGHYCELEYRLDDAIMTILHTRVPAPVGGRGIAGQLVAAAFATARAQRWRVRTECSYAARWAAQHPDVADLLA